MVSNACFARNVLFPANIFLVTIIRDALARDGTRTSFSLQMSYCTCGGRDSNIFLVKRVYTALAGDGRFAPGSFDSLSAVELSNAIAAALNIRLPGTLIYDYPSVESIVSHIASELGADASPAVPTLSAVREGVASLEGSTFQVSAGALGA